MGSENPIVDPQLYPLLTTKTNLTLEHFYDKVLNDRL